MPPNAAERFNSIKLLTLMAGRERLDEATETIGRYRWRKGERRWGAASGRHED